MMLYLTGASSSSKSNEAPQNDTMKSLGGFISSTLVPNAALNSLFDFISIKSIKDKTKETIAIGLVNKFDFAVSDVSLKMVYDQDNICKFKVAAVRVDKNNCMEHIYNRYSEPVNAEFYDATFSKGSVDVLIDKCGVIGEEIVFDPFDITAKIEKVGFDGTYEAINKAFSCTNEYRVKRLTEKTFRIERIDDTTIDAPFLCSFIATENANFIFSDKFKNINNNEVIIIDKLQPNEAIGIWIQRQISDIANLDNEQLLKDYDEKRKLDTIEEVDLVINYNIIETED